MKTQKKTTAFLTLTACFLTAASVSWGQETLIASWTFEEITISGSGTTHGPIAAAVGTGAAFGVHASAATTWSSPVGNGSPQSFSSNNWGVGDYYQFELSTIGFEGIVLSWEQTGSNTGPRDFAIQYSTDGAAFTTFSTHSITNDAWSSNPDLHRPQSVYLADLSSIAVLDGQETVYFRLTMTSTVAINGSAVASGGTSRVDNFNVMQIPEPSTYAAIFGVVVLAGAILRRRLARK